MYRIVETFLGFYIEKCEKVLFFKQWEYAELESEIYEKPKLYKTIEEARRRIVVLEKHKIYKL